MFKSYQREHYFDEMFGLQSEPLKHYRPIYDKLSEYDSTELNNKQKEVEQGFLEEGITFTVYGDAQGTEKIFPFDLIPRIISSKEWETIHNGLSQRVIALNLFLYDIYHDQNILKDKVIPEHVVKESADFRKEMLEVDVPQNIYTHICGTDLIRDAQGNYLALEDNARCPSGVSYLLENREAMKRAFPLVYAESKVQAVNHYPEILLKSLQYLSPRKERDPVCVLLTPGVYNSAYFEHTFLARKMGIEIVEGRDLIVENEKVYMRTTRGLVQVDVIYRRIDDQFIDPSVFKKDSILGIPNIMSSYVKGNVALANAIGTGVCDDKVIYAYVADMIRYYLSQEPIIDSVPTYLAWKDDDKQFILENLNQLVVKAANESGGYGMLMGPSSTKKQREEFKRAINANPRNYIAQPVISLSRHPTFCDEKTIEGRHVDLRPFVIYGEHVEIIPGGLTRVALKKDSLVVNSSQGGGSKDTWVIMDE